MAEKVAIVLPCYNSGEHLKATIDSIIDTMKDSKLNWRLILVESESTDGTKEYCDSCAANNSKIQVYHTKKEGITKAMNFGISKTNEDEDVFITQDDVVFFRLYKRNWLEEMNKLAQLKDCGAVIPISGGGVSGKDYIDGMKWGGTWSLYLPRKTISKVGVLDERYSPGPGDDIDLSYRIQKEGWQIYTANIWTDHHRMTEHGSSDDYSNQRGAGRFRQKYGMDYWEPYEFDGEKLLISPDSKKVLGCFVESGAIEDPYTMKMIKEITAQFRDDDIFIDVGGQVGMMSLMLQKGICLSFEPDPEAFRVLSINCQANSWKRVVPVNCALLDKQVEYKMSDETFQGLRHTIEEEGTGVMTRVLDEIILNNKFLHDNPVKLINVDVEGNDMRVLRGATQILTKQKPILIIETLAKEDNAWLESLGYKMVGMSGQNKVYEVKR